MANGRVDIIQNYCINYVKKCNKKMREYLSERRSRSFDKNNENEYNNYVNECKMREYESEGLGKSYIEVLIKQHIKECINYV